MPKTRDFFFGGVRREPTGPLPSVSPLERWRRPPVGGLRATWLCHSTVLIEIGGIRILTDPVWSKRASPIQFFGPKRFQPMPVKLKELPPIDLIVISHDHYDHLSYPTIRRLRKWSTPIVTSLGVGSHLEYWGVDPKRIIELDWWEAHAIKGVTVTATPSQHFSGRGLKNRNSTLWSSFSIRSDKHAVFFSGDTGLTTEFQTIRHRCGPFDLTLLEIGAFYPAWGDIHLGPENALKAHAMLGGIFLPIHWGTFSLALHPWDQPPERLYELTAGTNVPLVMPRLGETFEPSRIEKVRPWWRAAETERSEIEDETERPPPPWPID